MNEVSRKLMAVPYIFVLMNWAAIVGLYQFLKGVTGIWDQPPARIR